MKYLLLVLLSLFQWEFMCGPVPRVWDTSDYFRAGSFIFISGEHTCVIPSINATSYSSSSCVVTFSNAMPTVVWGSNIGIVSWDFSLSENIHFNFTSLYSTTMFGFKIFEKIANYIAPIRFRYMVVDDTFYDHFLIMSTVRFVSYCLHRHWMGPNHLLLCLIQKLSIFSYQILLLTCLINWLL